MGKIRNGDKDLRQSALKNSTDAFLERLHRAAGHPDFLFWSASRSQAFTNKE
jgi:hypothetical protein